MKTSLARDKKLTAKQCSGMTLIEALIALVLGLLITVGVMQLYLSNRQSYRLSSAQSRLQENARFALEFLSQDFRMAGYMGCLSRSLALGNTLNTPSNYIYNFEIPMHGFEWDEGGGVWLPTPVPAPAPPLTTADTGIISPLVGSDIITVRRADVNGIKVVAHANGSANLTMVSPGVPALVNCELVVVANCSAATVFQISTQAGLAIVHAATPPDPICVPNLTRPFPATPGNLTADLGRSFAGGGKVFRVFTSSYFVRDFLVNGDNVPTLYRKINSQNATALVEGVEAMEIFYGADTSSDGTANQYFTADNVADWSEIVSVRINLLVRSIEDNLRLTAETAYNFNGVAVLVDDKRLRRIFSTTIAIRNRLR